MLGTGEIVEWVGMEAFSGRGMNNEEVKRGKQKLVPTRIERL